jgi:hypothetical protein
LEALQVILQNYYDYDESFDFDTTKLKKAIQSIGEVGSTVASGNMTGIHLRKKELSGKDLNGTRGTRKIWFILMASNSQKAPIELNEKEFWLSALNESRAVVKALPSSFPSFLSRSRLRGGRGLRDIDRRISIARQGIQVAATGQSQSQSKQTLLPDSATASTTTATSVGLLCKSSTYWESPSAIRLFQPHPGESVFECLLRRIAAFQKIIDSWDDYDISSVIDGGEVEELSRKEVHRLSVKCIYLSHSYQLALKFLGQGTMNFQACCEKAIEDLRSMGFRYFQRNRTVYNLNVEFRQLEIFGIRHSTKTVTHIHLFAVFPEARDMLVKWAKTNLEMLNSETARQHILEEIIPAMMKVCNCELTELGLRPLDEDEFLAFVHLQNVCASTAWRWLRLLGFSYLANRKCYYTDNHEKQENIEHRITYIIRYFELELRAYRWVVLTESDAKILEDRQKNPLQKGLARKDFLRDGQMMREYHIDCHPNLATYVTPANKEKHGADLSVDFPQGQRPLIFVGQDESIYYQYLFSSKSWHGPDGEAKLFPKSQGEAVMISAFVGDQISFSTVMSCAQIDEVNEKYRDDHD